jgi:hypothetical protein
MRHISLSILDKQGRDTALWLSCLLVLMVPALCRGAGSYEISWYTIGGGGGISTGGPYVLTGTIGQPDAAWSAGGSYELLGGFWPGGPLCIVDFYHFGRFAELWLCTGTDLAADLDKDSDVDFDDLKEFAYCWLAYCPAGWQLK